MTNQRPSLENAKVLIDNFQLTEARSCLEQLILENGKNDEAFYLLGNIARREGNFAQAINYYSAALEANAENNAAKSGIEMLNEILAYRNTDLINP